MIPGQNEVDLIAEIFGADFSQKNFWSMKEKVIMAATNRRVDIINSKIVYG